MPPLIFISFFIDENLLTVRLCPQKKWFEFEFESDAAASRGRSAIRDRNRNINILVACMIKEIF